MQCTQRAFLCVLLASAFALSSHAAAKPCVEGVWLAVSLNGKALPSSESACVHFRDDGTLKGFRDGSSSTYTLYTVTDGTLILGMRDGIRTPNRVVCPSETKSGRTVAIEFPADAGRAPQTVVFERRASEEICLLELGGG